MEFRSALSALAHRTNCPTFDAELWEAVFTHASLRNEFSPQERSTERLLEVVRRIGDEALRTSLYEYCLDQKGMDQVETSRAYQCRVALLRSILDEFQLISMCRTGNAFDGLGANETLQLEFAEKFLGVMTVSSSYSNVRQLIWQRIESNLFSSPQWASYDATDPKSWLQEYCQRFYGKQPAYQLLDESGPEHAKTFRCRVVLPDKRAAEASGSSLKMAQKQAAATLINNLQLTRQMATRAKVKFEVTPPCLNIPPTRIDKYLTQAASTFAQKLQSETVNKYHLAVALTLPASTRKHVETNVRHKLLGDGLETLAFVLFVFQTAPMRIFGTSNIAHFIAAICSNRQHAPLFDLLGLEPIVGHEPEVRISEQAKADVIKAIAAAVYLSTRDFTQFLHWMTTTLGSWCQDTITRIGENPLLVKEPKSFLQELLQGQEEYKAEYADQQSGPEHRLVFSTTLFLSGGGRRVRLSEANGNTLREAQQLAATRTISCLVPSGNVGDKLPAIATHFWKSYLDGLINGKPGVIVGACGVEQFRTINSFTGFLGLKAFSLALPEVAPYLRHPKFVDLLLKSIGKLAFTSPRHVISLAARGIALITSHSPDDLKAFTSSDIDEWLADLRRASAGLKVPASQIRFPLLMIPTSELSQIREWNLSVPSRERDQSVSESMFSHAVTVLESLSQGQEGSNSADVSVQIRADWQSLKFVLKKTERSRVQLEQIVDELSLNAFFSGVSDTIQEDASSFTIEIKGVYFQNEDAHVTVYIELLRRLYEGQSYFQGLHRIVHDLKNQVISIRNYAMRASREPGNRYQMYAAIELLQQNIRNRESALSLFFRAAEQAHFVPINLQRTIRDVFAKQIISLPDRIKPEFSDRIDSAHVVGSKEFLTSLLENLTLNAIDAMPDGGVLSVSASYNTSDSMLEINVADTGVGIPPELIPGLFTTLKSTKAKGMGLGLATVKRIVEQHNGLIDVVSRLGEGTKFTVLLPLQAESEMSNASISN